MNKIQELLSVSKYSDYPDALVTCELCIAMARLEKRNVNVALRACARMLVTRINNMKLRNMLTMMSIDPEPMVGVHFIAEDVQRLERAMEVYMPRMNISDETIQTYIDLKGEQKEALN